MNSVIQSISTVVILILLVFFRNGTGDSVVAQEWTTEQITKLIRELDSSEFETRQGATTELLKANVAAIVPMEQMIPRLSQEARSRAFKLLRNFALSEQIEVGAAAESSLRRLAKLRVQPIAAKAQLMVESITELRESRALARLEKLGAKIEFRAIRVEGEYFQVPYTLRIDNKWKGQAKDIAHVQNLTTLHELWLEGPEVTDELLEQLSGLSEIDTVSIRRSEITNRSIELVAKYPALSYLDVHYCKVDDDSIGALKKIRRAIEFRIYGSMITREAAEKLKSELFDVDVDIRAGGFLGVGCEREQGKLIVNVVDTNSAADIAGLRVGDVITQFEGKSVTTMNQLTMLIANYRAKESVNLKWIRGSKNYSRQVILGEVP